MWEKSVCQWGRVGSKARVNGDLQLDEASQRHHGHRTARVFRQVSDGQSSLASGGNRVPAVPFFRATWGSP
jgi:hypothetical protein